MEGRSCERRGYRYSIVIKEISAVVIRQIAPLWLINFLSGFIKSLITRSKHRRVMKMITVEK